MKLTSFLSLICIGSCTAADLTLIIGTQSSIYNTTFSTDSGSFTEAKLAFTSPTSSYLSFSKDHKNLYSTNVLSLPDSNKSIGGVASYSISDSLVLEANSMQPTGGSGTCHVSIDQTGRFLFSADYGSGRLCSFPIGEDGSISEAVSSIQLTGSSVHPHRQTATHAHSIYSTPDNKHVYAADLGTDSIHCYSLDADSGKLNHLSTAKTPAGSGPRHIAIHPDGKRLFVLNELTCTLSTFDRNAETGELSLLDTRPTLKEDAKGMSCSEIKLSPDAKHLYTASRDISGKSRDSISHFTVPQDPSVAPELKQVLVVPISIPRHFTITPEGKWLIAGGQNSNQLISIKRDPATGALSLTDNSLSIPSPQCILVKP